MAAQLVSDIFEAHVARIAYNRVEYGSTKSRRKLTRNLSVDNEYFGLVNWLDVETTCYALKDDLLRFRTVDRIVFLSEISSASA